MYTIKYEYHHYAVYKDGVFYCSADSYHEAEDDIKMACQTERQEKNDSIN